MPLRGGKGLSKKVKDTEYLFLSAMLAARSSRMLGRDGIERILNAPGYAECAKMLIENGYADMSEMTAGEVEETLAQRRADIFAELLSLSPASAPVDIFRMKYDYHNIKTAVKSAAQGISAKHLYSRSGRVSPENIERACTSDEASDIPVVLAAAMEEAKTMLARTGSPQSADVLLDKACFAEMADMANATGSEFLAGYVRFMIDALNLKAAVRVLRIGADKGFLLNVLISGGNVDIQRFAEMSSDDFGGIFTATPLTKAAAIAQETLKGAPLAELELACENAEMEYLSTAKLKGFGEMPVVLYIADVLREMTAVRMVLTGLLAGLDKDSIRKKLSDKL